MRAGPSRPEPTVPAGADHGDDRGVVMQVGPPPAPPTPAPPTPTSSPTDRPNDRTNDRTNDGTDDRTDRADHRPRRRTARRAVVVVAVVLAGVVGAVLLDGGSATPSVRTPVMGDGTGELEPAPPAPAAPVTRRWSVLLSDTDVATGVAVVDDVVVAMLEPPFPGARGDDERPDERVVVVGHDRADGSRRWVRRFPAHTAVVVGPPGGSGDLP